MAAAASKPPSSSSGDSGPSQNVQICSGSRSAAKMDHSAPSDLHPSPSYPSPNAAQMGQGVYYATQAQRGHISDEEEMQLSAELSRQMGADLPGPTSRDMSNGHAPGRPLQPATASSQGMAPPALSQSQHSPAIPFTPNQQVGMDPNHDLSYGDDSARRKRSKVSRACDECRRKKIRCDASTDGGAVETCSNCKRISQTCQFSRVPMKRGPSKGYIKELADRVNALEGQVTQTQIPSDQMSYRAMDEEGSPGMYESYSPVEGGLGRKRTFSVSEGRGSNAFIQPQTPARSRLPSIGWPGNPSQITSHGYAPASQHDSFPSLTSPTHEQAASGSGEVKQPFWTALATSTAQQLKPGAIDGGDGQVGWDESTKESYLRNIHPTLPILPTHESVLKQLQSVDRQLREVWNWSLYAALGGRDCLPPFHSTLSCVEQAEEIVFLSTRESTSERSTNANFTLLQSMVFLSLQADVKLRPASGSSRLTRGFLVQSAVDVGYFLTKKFGRHLGDVSHDADPDTEANIARRMWVVTAVLARFHAMGAGGDDPIRPECAISTSNDIALLPMIPRYLAELSDTISDVIDLSSKRSPLNTSLLFRMLHRIKRSSNQPVSFTSEDSGNIVLLTSTYISLLLKRHLYALEPVQILATAINLAHLLSQTTTPSPFHLHFCALTAITLLEVTDLENFALSERAYRGLEDLKTALRRNIIFPARLDSSTSWAESISAFIDAKPRLQPPPIPSKAPTQAVLASKGMEMEANGTQPAINAQEQRSLQHLADLAVQKGADGQLDDLDGAMGKSGMENGNGGVAWTEIDFGRLATFGYLNVIPGL